MKISKITIKSLFGIKEWSGDGKNIELVGDNGTGKTSMPDLFQSIDKNMVKSPVAYCKTHKGYLSTKQMKVHKCLQIGCTGLERLEHPYWEERQRKKDEAKRKKKQQ